MSGGEARTQGAPFRGPVFAVLEAWFELQKLTLLDVLYVRKGVSDTKEASSAKESPSDARALCLISPIVPDWMRQEAELVKVKWCALCFVTRALAFFVFGTGSAPTVVWSLDTVWRKGTATRGAASTEG